MQLLRERNRAKQSDTPQVAEQLGLRTEKLLLLAIPLLLLAYVAGVAVTLSRAIEGRYQATCLEGAAQILERTKFGEPTQTTNAELLSTTNSQRLEQIFSEAYKEEGDVCSDPQRWLTPAQRDRPIMEVARLFAEKAKEIRDQPVSFGGVTLPFQAKIELYGHQLILPYDSIASILIVLLLPAFAIWSLTLMSNRGAEIRCLNGDRSLQPFPHLLNLFSYFSPFSSGTKSASNPGHLARVTKWLPRVYRTLLIGITVGVPCATYTTVIFLWMQPGSWFWAIAAVLMYALPAVPVMIEISQPVGREGQPHFSSNGSRG